MNANDLTHAKDPDIRAALGALRRAAQLARKTVIQTNTRLVIVRDGRLQRIAAAELVQQEAVTPPSTMTDQNQAQLGKTLWNIADQLRGAMDADDFRDYMLSFLFLRYLSDNYVAAVQRELGADYPKLEADGRRVHHHRRRPHLRANSKARCPQDHKKGLMQQLFPSTVEVK
jgi:hypothetical protein